jgi:hypothetical protein
MTPAAALIIACVDTIIGAAAVWVLFLIYKYFRDKNDKP